MEESENPPVVAPAPPPDAAGPERLAELEAERDAARAELEQLKRRQAAGELARKFDFADPDYLEFRCARAGIEPGDAAAAQEFMAGLREQSPRLFRLRLTPGAPDVPASAAPEPGRFRTRPAAGDLARLIADAPERD